MYQHWRDWQRDSSSEIKDVVIKILEMYYEKMQNYSSKNRAIQKTHYKI